jgi:PAS domain S-box-containing protein
VAPLSVDPLTSFPWVGEPLRAALSAGLVGVAVADTSRVLEANPEYLRVLGGSEDELERGELSWLRLTAPESMPAESRAIAELRASGSTPAYEKDYVRRDGTRVPVLVRRALVRDDPLQLISLVIDRSPERDLPPEERAVVADLERALTG